MNKKLLKFILVLLVFNCICAKAQSPEVEQLRKKVAEFNNNGKYDSSAHVIVRYLEKPNITNEDRYFCNRLLSITYKYLYSYDQALIYLNKALEFGLKTSDPNYFISNVRYERAAIYFDTKRYREADSLIKIIEKEKYQYLTDENFITVQIEKAYLLFLDKKYEEAEVRYNILLKKMQKENPCNMPLIYAKKIELYSAMNKFDKMQENYNKSLLVCDSCNLLKNKLYTIEMMRYAYRNHEDYKKAFEYYTLYDELFTQLKSDEYINKLKQIEKQFESEKKEQQLIIKDQMIKANNRLILLLIAGIVLLIMLAIVFLLYSIKTKQREQNNNTLLFTRQLLERIEDERKRIAADLHDSVGNELLSLKSNYNNNENPTAKIDSIINDIRIIGRNLGPVMFDKIGLKESLEQLVERIQTQNNFLLTAEINYNKSLSSKSELQVYRIIQEAINNMIKHSKARAGKIEVNETDTRVLIEIKDNGVGFDTNDKINNTKSFGLLNMIERSKTINGSLAINSNEKGTVITIEIPKENL